MSRPRQSLGDDGSVLVTYDLSSGNNPITVYASATAPGYIDTLSDYIRLDASMVGGEPILRTVLLPRPCSASVLRGKILGPEGQPAPGARADIDGIVYQADDLGEFDINRSFELPGAGLKYVSMGATPTDAQYADRMARYEHGGVPAAMRRLDTTGSAATHARRPARTAAPDHDRHHRPDHRPGDRRADRRRIRARWWLGDDQRRWSILQLDLR